MRELAKMANDDGLVKWPTSHKRIAERSGYSLVAVRKSLRRLSGRTDEPLALVAVEPGTGRDLSRYAVARSWDEAPPALPPKDAPVPAVPERPKDAPERRKIPAARLAEVAPHGDAWLPDDESTPEPPADVDEQFLEEPPSPVEPPAGDVVTLLPAAAADDGNRETWCVVARERGRPHRGKRCCGMTPRQMQAREEKERKEAARRREQERLRAMLKRDGEPIVDKRESAAAQEAYAIARAARSVGRTAG